MKYLCQNCKVKLIFQGAYRLSGTGIVEYLEIIDVGCNLKQFDGLTWLTLTPIFYDRRTPLLGSTSPLHNASLIQQFRESMSAWPLTLQLKHWCQVHSKAEYFYHIRKFITSFRSGHGAQHKMDGQHNFVIVPLHTGPGCWFVGGDSVTGALHILYLQLSPPSPSPLAPIKSRMETFWYRQTQVHLENSR